MGFYSDLMGYNGIYPLVMTNIAIENGHRNSGFSHEKWWFSIVMLIYQRVTKVVNNNSNNYGLGIRK